MTQAIQRIDYLSSSPARVEILECLYEQERVEKDELKERIDASRTTIQRNVDGLKNQGWVEGNNREYWITPAGRQVAEQFLKLHSTVHAVERLRPFLELIPWDELDIKFHMLAGANVTNSTETDPYAPVNRHIELMTSAEEFRCLLPAIGLQPLMAARDCVIKRGNSQEVIVDPDIVDTLQNEDYRGIIEELIVTGQAEILVSAHSIPFYLGLGDDTVQIGVGGDNGAPQSVVELEAREVQEWGDRKYNEYRRETKPLHSIWGDASNPEADVG